MTSKKWNDIEQMDLPQQQSGTDNGINTDFFTKQKLNSYYHLTMDKASDGLSIWDAPQSVYLQ